VRSCEMCFYTSSQPDKNLCICGCMCVCRRLAGSCHDDASKFLRLVAKPGRNFIEFDDFLPLIQV